MFNANRYPQNSTAKTVRREERGRDVYYPQESLAFQAAQGLSDLNNMVFGMRAMGDLQQGNLGGAAFNAMLGQGQGFTNGMIAQGIAGSNGGINQSGSFLDDFSKDVGIINVVALCAAGFTTLIKAVRSTFISPIEQSVVKGRQQERTKAYGEAYGLFGSELKMSKPQAQRLIADIQTSHVLSKAMDKVYAAFEANPNQINASLLNNFAKDINVHVKNNQDRSQLMSAIKDRMADMAVNMNNPQFMNRNRECYGKIMEHARDLYKAEFIQDSTKLRTIAGISANPVKWVYAPLKSFYMRHTRTTDRALLNAISTDEGLASFKGNNIEKFTGYGQRVTSSNNVAENLLHSVARDKDVQAAIKILKNAGVGESKLAKSALPRRGQSEGWSK